MLRDWLADTALLCTVLLLVLYCASPRASPCLGRNSSVALPAVGYALVLPAVGYALVLPAVGFALLPAVGFALLPAVGCSCLACVGSALLPAVGFALLGSFHPVSPARR